MEFYYSFGELIHFALISLSSTADSFGSSVNIVYVLVQPEF